MPAFLLCLLLLFPFRALAEIAVVVHPDSPVQSLSVGDVSDLYLGRVHALGGTDRLLVLDQPSNSPLRGHFFGSVNGMDLRRVNAYWARLQFSGDTQPPVQLPDSQSIIEVVQRNRLAIGYIDARAVTSDVRVVLVLHRNP